MQFCKKQNFPLGKQPFTMTVFEFFVKFPLSDLIIIDIVAHFYAQSFTTTPRGFDFLGSL